MILSIDLLISIDIIIIIIIVNLIVDKIKFTKKKTDIKKRRKYRIKNSQFITNTI